MKYTESHEWIEIEGDVATVGITDHAQKELGDVVYVELPTEGHTVKAGEEIVVLESTKAAVDLYSPLSGEISKINTTLREFPEKVNQSAQTEGWLFKLRITQPEEVNSLLSEADYQNLL
ncbi:MAG: Glycine cleavage system H protein [Chlamydiae bacterium]|nr:Glycine cleavage system H protein [Chlamydiota bacterium]